MTRLRLQTMIWISFVGFLLLLSTFISIRTSSTCRVHIQAPIQEREHVNSAEKSRLAFGTYEDQTEKRLRLLKSHIYPKTVYYVWCGVRSFLFNHYVSMLSVIKEIEPDYIIFYCDFNPQIDDQSYNLWFKELLDYYPFINVQRALGVCQNGHINMEFVYGLLATHGGIWVDENTIFTNSAANLYDYAFVHGYNSQDKSGFLAAKASVFTNTVTDRVFETKPDTKDVTPQTVYLNSLNSSNILGNSTTPSTQSEVFKTVTTAPGLLKLFDSVKERIKIAKCPTFQEFLMTENDAWCVTTMPVYYPKDIWEENDKFGRLARHLYYGSPDIPIVRKSTDTLVPNIGHVVWMGGGEMDYLFYLCILSLIYVAEVDMVYLHGDTTPSGPLWVKIKNEPKLRFVQRDTPETVFGTEVVVKSHVSDIYRVDIMSRYGGIYIDTDAIMVRKLDDEIRSYDAVASYDWYQWPPFPDAINFGVTIGKPNTEYWKKFMESMKIFRDGDWSWNGLRQPYHIKEKYPHLIKIDPHLAVICYFSKCHPTWWPNYHSEMVHHENSDSLPDWRNDAFAYHFTHPNPDEFANETALLSSSGMIADMGKLILKKAGRLPQSS